ncbi:MAG TPA: hypothetical protein VFF11_15610, partial [Candidatus Binatia bacterium]|nr:hypothetical protein [Candidatus Binatia bacterium]
ANKNVVNNGKRFLIVKSLRSAQNKGIWSKYGIRKVIIRLLKATIQMQLPRSNANLQRSTQLTPRQNPV